MIDPAEECQCRDARKWRAYWSREAIAARLTDELDLYRRICHERWNAAANDVRGVARMDNTPPRTGPSFAELERRRNER